MEISKADLDKLFKTIDLLKKEVQSLKKRLSKYENPKNSSNSSIPPSQDENRIKKTCSCGCQTVSKYPNNVTSHIGYGENIESLTAYFHTRQYVPYQRMQELFNTIFNVPISQAGLHNILNKFAKKAEPIYNIIRDGIVKSKVVGTDETGARINNKRGWMWAWQTEKLTFIKASDNRGIRTILETSENGLPNSILVNDHWKPHYKSRAKTHQMCTAHLLRDLNYLTELYKQSWSSEFKKLILDAIELKKQMIASDYYQNNNRRDEIISRFKNYYH